MNLKVFPLFTTHNTFNTTLVYLVECFFSAALIFMSSFNSCGFYSRALSALHFINIIRTMSAQPLKRVMGMTESVCVCVHALSVQR